jgi:hypothetical protein
VARHLLLFVAAGPDLHFSDQITQGDDGKFVWQPHEIALRARLGIGGRW